MSKPTDNSIHFQTVVPVLHNGVLTESLHRSPGSEERLLPRITQDFTFYLCPHLPFWYDYRRSRMLTPARTLAIFLPNETFSGEDAGERPVSTIARLMYLPVSLLKQAAEELTGKPFSQTPSFSTALLHDETLTALYLKAHRQIQSSADTLAADNAQAALLERLLTTHAAISPFPLLHEEPARIRRACDYLQEHFAHNISLQELADSVELSAYHFHRLFQRQLGMTPHAYLQNVRIHHARRLLAQGFSVGETAQETGFADESHFIRRFRRLVGITPGRYASALR